MIKFKEIKKFHEGYIQDNFDDCNLDLIKQGGATVSYFRPRIRLRQLSDEVLSENRFQRTGWYLPLNNFDQKWARKNMSKNGMRIYRGKQMLRIGFLACSLTGLSGLNFNEPVAIRGERAKSIPTPEVDKTVTERSRAAYRGMSYSEKYLTQFIQPKATSTRSTYAGTGSGLLGLISFDLRNKVSIGESCLANSAYDTRSAKIRINGFSNGGGDIPAPAAINFDSTTKTLSVISSSPSAHELKFTENTNYHNLLPADEATESTLSAAYSCTLSHAAYVEDGQGITRRVIFPSNY